MTNKVGRRSKYTIAFEKIYPKDKPRDLKTIGKHFDIDEEILQDVYNRGVGAFRTAGARPSVKSEDQWAKARTYKALLNILRVREGKKIKGGKGEDTDLIQKAVKNKKLVFI